MPDTDTDDFRLPVGSRYRQFEAISGGAGGDDLLQTSPLSPVFALVLNVLFGRVV